jgi:hypothetical protein
VSRLVARDEALAHLAIGDLVSRFEDRLGVGSEHRERRRLIAALDSVDECCSGRLR